MIPPSSAAITHRPRFGSLARPIRRAGINALAAAITKGVERCRSRRALAGLFAGREETQLRCTRWRLPATEHLGRTVDDGVVLSDLCERRSRRVDEAVG